MRILIVTKNWLGDMLFQIPAIEEIRRTYPEAEIICLTPERCVPVIKNHPAVDQIIVFDERTTHRSLGQKLRFITTLRMRAWDRIYLFHRSRTRAFLMMMLRAGERIGFRNGRRWLLTHPVAEPETRLHHVDYFLHLLEKTGHQIKGDRCYRFFVTSEDRRRSDALTAGAGAYACFHLGANWEPKRWPVEHFSKLAVRLSESWKGCVVLTGGPGDRSLAESFCRQTGEEASVRVLTGRTDLGTLGAVFEKAAFVVSADSGPMHIASAVGTRTLALFGPTDPALTGPRGRGENQVIHYVAPGYEVPWYGKEMPESGWMQKITPEEVFRHLEQAGWLTRQVAGKEP